LRQRIRQTRLKFGEFLAQNRHSHGSINVALYFFFSANQILAARRSERLEALKKELLQQHKDITVDTLSLDVRQKKNIDTAISKLPQKNDIDILVNNAGLVIGLDHLSDVTEDAFDTMFETNVKGLVFLTQAILPGMKANNKGHIINIGSVAGKEAYPGGSIYCGM